MEEKNKREKEFLNNLGKGKTIFECEAENNFIDEKIEGCPMCELIGCLCYQCSERKYKRGNNG